MTDLALDLLEARGLIRLATVEPELEYLFRHALLQDTAYESLLKQERRQLHQVVGQTLEELYPDRQGELAAVLAMHFEQAGDTEKAISYLMAAADFARDRNAIVEAFDLYGRAASLLPSPTDAEDHELLRRRINIELGRAYTGFSFLSDKQSEDILEPLVAQSARLGDLRLEADVHLAIGLARQLHGSRPDTDQLLKRSLDRVAEIARQLDDPLIAALPRSMIGLFQVFTGRLREGVATLEETQPLLAQKRDFVGSSFAYVALAIGYARLGEFDKGEAAARHAAELGEQGDVVVRVDARIGLSTVHSIRGDLDLAVPLALECTQMAEQAGATACVVVSNYVLGDAYQRQGRFDAAKIAFARGDEITATTGQLMFRPSIAAYLRSLGANSASYPSDNETFDAAIAEARSIGDLWGEALIVWKRAETESQRPAGERDQSRMLADFTTAAKAFDEMGARPFLARVMRDWGHSLQSVGQGDEGRAKLREARDLLAAMGIKREADELTAELGS